MWLLAQASEQGTRTFEFGRMVGVDPFSLQSVLLAVVAVAVIALVIFFYIRDCVEIGGIMAALLITLRLGAFAGLLWIWLQPQWRVEKETIIPSRVQVLVDTSQSMLTSDEGGSPGQSAGVGGRPRINVVIDALQKGPLLQKLQQSHDVFVIAFDGKTNTVASLFKLNPEGKAAATHSDEPAAAPPDWAALLTAKGSSTLVGESLNSVLNEVRGDAPLAGIVVFSDGGDTSTSAAEAAAGTGIDAAIKNAKDKRVPIYTVGLGTVQQDMDLRIYTFEVPRRTYAGDAYEVKGLLVASGLPGQASTDPESRPEVTVELRALENENEDREGALIDSTTVILGPSGEQVPFSFKLDAEAVGRRVLQVRALPPDPRVQRTVDMEAKDIVEIIDPKTRVLLFAGGPSREYHFLRNQLSRDSGMISDVLLQTAQQGISQEANEILFDFPSDKETLYKYDCIVAFDPDWRELDENQIRLLEKWVAEEGGGLIVIAGPVSTDEWVHDRKSEDLLRKIKALYPVDFKQHFAILDDSKYDNAKPRRLRFTPYGEDAQYLWLSDDRIDSSRNWDEFEGVFGYYGVQGAKPVAQILARLEDPDALNPAEAPVFLVSQFYGSGRVLYMGSGEFWRLRSQDEGFFEVLYTKVLRHVSQSRLLRGSNRGRLLVDNKQVGLGETVPIRVQLKDSQLDPLVADSVELEYFTPDGIRHTTPLTAIKEQPGIFGGQFGAYQAGVYRISVAIPGSDETLSDAIKASLPDLENKHKQRNDSLLSRLAEGTGGRYYVGVPAAISESDAKSLVAVATLPDRSRIKPERDEPESLWDNQWTLFIICGLLCMEWLIRRLAKLA